MGALPGTQVRIVDFVIDTMDEEQWTQACAALIQMVAADGGSLRSRGRILPAIPSAGFRALWSLPSWMPAYLGDPNNNFTSADLMELSLLTGDSSYLMNEQDQLWC
jgi:hypothetical protein